MQATRRNRIVIDLNPRSSGATSLRGQKRRWPKVLAILGLVAATAIVLAVAVGFIWWQRYKTTPAYSLASLVYSLQHDDNPTTAFDQFVDTNKILDSLSAQVTEKTISRYGAAMNPALRQRVQDLIPELLPGVREQAMESVRFTLADHVKQITQASGKRPLFVTAITLPYLINIATEGDTATVNTTVRDRPTELLLERSADRWKITAVRNDAIVQRIVERMMQDLPPIGAPPGERPGRDPFRVPRRLRRGR